ncbi:MAG: hypothetical protein AAF845_05755 [Bacteroidota bacterium]
MIVSRLGAILRRRRRSSVDVEVRVPSLGTDLALRVALSPAFETTLVSGDPLVWPDPLDDDVAARVAGRVMGVLAPEAPREFVDVAALVEAARTVFDVYLARSDAEQVWAETSLAAVRKLAGVPEADGQDAGNLTATERFLAAGLDFVDWQALHAAPLHEALIWLGYREVQATIDADAKTNAAGEAQA